MYNYLKSIPSLYPFTNQYINIKSSFIRTIYRSRLHEGVIRDVERQQRRKMENIVVMQQQIDLTKQLRGETKFQDELR